MKNWFQLSELSVTRMLTCLAAGFCYDWRACVVVFLGLCTVEVLTTPREPS